VYFKENGVNMTANKNLTLSMILCLVITVSLGVTFPVHAALSITSVEPNVVVNNTSTIITITGSDFLDPSVVYLSDTALTTTFVSSTKLTAVIPSGITPGTYDVRVDVPGVGTASMSGGLSVLSPTATPEPFSRPQIVIDMYKFSVSAISYGGEFNLNVSLDNAGGSTAYGIQITFMSSDLLMLKNGGVIAVGSLGTVGKANISQTMTAATGLYGITRVSLEMNVTYYDETGTTYSEKFTIYIPVASSGYSGVTYPTSTPSGIRHSQLVITNYTTDIDPLQPGTIFNLTLTVKNEGTIDAKSVTMIVGGGSSSGGGTPMAGVSGSSGEFTNFAPVGTSNVKSIGNIPAGLFIEANQELIVNVTTNPGAYPIKISFVYTDSSGNPITDEQIITLLVYRLPQVEIGFYQPVGEIYTGQAGMLPLQVVNLGRNTVILGTMRVETSGGMIENGEILIGALDMGGYFPLDAIVYPDAPGTLELLISIDYTDDFNQQRTITQTLTLEVIEGFIEPTPDPSMPEEPVTSAEDTIWQKIWRFVLGIFGLDSSRISPEAIPSEVPFDVFPIEPVPSGGKG
jgi:hypothetical protein